MSKIEWPSDSDKFEAIGYLAKPGVIDTIEATVPADKLKKFKDEYHNKYSIEFPYVTKAGSKFGYQFRIYLSDTEGCPDFLASQLDEKYKNRINDTSFIAELVNEYGFRFTKKPQNEEQIRNLVRAKGTNQIRSFEKGFRVYSDFLYALSGKINEGDLPQPSIVKPKVAAKAKGRRSFRSFNFLNYIEEKGLGDLSTVFTKAKELKHNIRIRNIMNFFFNFENIEQIYEKELLLDAKSKELEKLSLSYQEYSRSKVQQQKIFKELQLDYTGKYSTDYKTFCDFRSSYVRKAKANSKDLVYLSQSSFSLAEEMKIYNFMKNQSSNMVDRKERIKRLLSIMTEIVGDEPDYEEYTRFIKDTIETLDEENVILSLTDYSKAIKDIEKEKKKLDYQIELLKASSEKLSYEDAMKKVGLLEHLFVVLQEEVDFVKYHDLSQEVEGLKKEIKELKSSFNQKKINDFNKRLTEIYLESGLEIQHLQDDIREEGFALEFDPFRLCLSAKHKKGDNIVNYMPGSMARQTHIQMLVYLTMFEYLNKNFSGFIYMPLLVIDSANQPMGVDSFEKVYPVLIEMAEKVGIQTIFLSKDMIGGIKDADLIDISDGLNKFHKA